LRFIVGKERTDITRVSIMSSQIQSLQPLLREGAPLVVGTLHDQSGLKFLKRAAVRDSLLRGIDLLEVRLDALPLTGLPVRWPLPLIATARHPAEGGAGNLSQSRRQALLESALPWASALDIELRSAHSLAPVIAHTHQQGRTLILSHHDFKATPTLPMLKKLASQAAAHGADLFKVATLLRDRHDLQRLIDLQLSRTEIPVIAMGMGDAGRFSRIVLAGFGTPLCYGWLGSPQVPGQWPAQKLRGILGEVLPA
jgi:3-dehydroquinate dehydratase-1